MVRYFLMESDEISTPGLCILTFLTVLEAYKVITKFFIYDNTCTLVQKTLFTAVFLFCYHFISKYSWGISLFTIPRFQLRTALSFVFCVSLYEFAIKEFTGRGLLAMLFLLKED